MRIEIFGERRQTVLFDGVMLEVFGFTDGGARCHVVHIDQLTIKTKRKGARRLEGVINRSTGFQVELDDTTHPLAEQLIAEVNRVRAESYGLGPVKD